jgi:methylmalonyl-CoA mutase N-terminal domain/subunit
VTRTADPLAGSYYVEALTAELETRAYELLADVERRGGAARAIAEGFIQDQIGRSAYAAQRAIESEEDIVVGVNRYADGAPIVTPPSPDFSALAAKQVERLKAVRGARDAVRVRAALAAVTEAARKDGAPMMEPIIEAVRARATIGEITGAMEREWGRFGGARA